MSYIGNTPTNQNFVAGADQFNGTGSQTVFTLSRNVNTVFDIFVAISNVPQDPYNAYSVSGNTLTFTSAPPAGTGNIYVVYRATNVQTFVPSPGSTVSGPFGIQGNLNFYGTGNRITGDFSNATQANRVALQTSTVNGSTSVTCLPNGTGLQGAFNAFNNSDPTNAAFMQIRANATETTLVSGVTGTGTNLPMVFNVNASERMRIDTSGNVGIGVTPITNTTTGPLQVASGGLQINNTNSGVFGNLYFSSSAAAWRYANNGSGGYIKFGSGATNAIEMGGAVNNTGGAGATATVNLFATIDTSGNFQFNSGYGSVATAYGCRAWVNFNGTGAVAIRASGNVSSITDNGVGDYTVNFTTAMPDANYAPVTASQYARIICSVGTITTSGAQIRTYDEGTPGNFDANPVLVAIFR